MDPGLRSDQSSFGFKPIAAPILWAHLQSHRWLFGFKPMSFPEPSGRLRSNQGTAWFDRQSGTSLEMCIFLPVFVGQISPPMLT